MIMASRPPRFASGMVADRSEITHPYTPESSSRARLFLRTCPCQKSLLVENIMVATGERRCTVFVTGMTSQ
jgi:hypothetical protein